MAILVMVVIDRPPVVIALIVTIVARPVVVIVADVGAHLVGYPEAVSAEEAVGRRRRGLEVD